MIFLVFTLLLSGLIPDARGIQITNLKVPRAVKNNSGSAVVLDCDYYLTPEERNTGSYGGLVVKWYLDNFDSPVYQWIPGKKPQDLGALRGRLNVSHRASDNPATMYRALYIPNPTTDISGDYKCLVSTFNDEDFMVKKMVVFATERSLVLEQTKPDPGIVNVTCRAHGVYPEPRMAIYKDPDRKNMQNAQMEGLSVEISDHHISYDVTAWKSMAENELSSPTIFVCELTIYDIDYVARRNIVYYPDSGGYLSSHKQQWICLVLIMLIRHISCS